MSTEGFKLDKFLAATIEEAEIGLQEGGIPIGSVCSSEHVRGQGIPFSTNSFS